MTEGRRGTQDPAEALAEIDNRGRQAVAMSDPLPVWAVLATMVFVASMFALRDLPAKRLTVPLGYAIAVLPLAVAILRLRFRRATLHPSLRRLGWWIPCLVLVIAMLAVSSLPPYVAGLGVRHPATVTGIVVACVVGPLMVLADRLQRRYIIKRMVRR
ncbi:MAG: hypothetical protein QOE51_3885 [Actinoplanes sp.]|nr:hypothetical protein [Actinoplanes sp.]